MRRLVTTFALSLAGLAIAGASSADIVVLDNGRFLKAESYQIEGELVRLELENGGQLALPILRIDRILGDEIEPARPQEPAAKSAQSSVPFDLGFAPGHKPPTTRYGDLIFEIARRFNVNPDLVVAIVRAESAFDPNAVSIKGARGLMQLMPLTGMAYGFRPEELFDAETNIIAGVSYLETLIERYADDLELVLAAYNAGETAVERHKGVPPFRETQEYIRRVYSFLEATPASGSTAGK